MRPRGGGTEWERVLRYPLSLFSNGKTDVRRTVNQGGVPPGSGGQGGPDYHRIGVIIDLGGLCNPSQSCVLQAALHILRSFPIPRCLSLEVYRQAGRLDVLGDVDDLGEPRHPQRDVLRRHSRKVEGVQRHLSRGLSDGLRRHRPNHLAREGQRLNRRQSFSEVAQFDYKRAVQFLNPPVG